MSDGESSAGSGLEDEDFQDPSDEDYSTTSIAPDADIQDSADAEDHSTMFIALDVDIENVVGLEGKLMKVNSGTISGASMRFGLMCKIAHRALAEDSRYNWEGFHGMNVYVPSPKIICLPEDDAEALGNLFTVIHRPSDPIDASLHPGMLLRVAIASDKFKLTRSLERC
ncbi:hypothetical protein B0H63DRAFT_451357 [Podospora didyma]|uniref:Uncharacterized protein n=1 Tax=Podospora didyma TaxID=330526 RepID=A0AAE0KJ56_9PEZI|nr:hypothetical protein B0H63DRAFT_451357 [Podospora didyma]